jgi:hypothetical protein
MTLPTSQGSGQNEGHPAADRRYQAGVESTRLHNGHLRRVTVTITSLNYQWISPIAGGASAAAIPMPTFYLPSPRNNEARPCGGSVRLCLDFDWEHNNESRDFPSSQSLQDIGAALERGNPSRFIARHEGGINRSCARSQRART